MTTPTPLIEAALRATTPEEQYKALMDLGRQALSQGPGCSMGPLYMQVRHPDGEHATYFDDESVFEAALAQGLIDPEWAQELVFLHPQDVANRAIAAAWHYKIKGLDVPDHVHAAFCEGACGGAL